MKSEPPRRHGPFDPRYRARGDRSLHVRVRPAAGPAAEKAPDETLVAAVETWEGEGGSH